MKRRKRIYRGGLLTAAALFLVVCGCGPAAHSRKAVETDGDQAATAPALEVGEEGMEPVYGEALKDGSYEIQVDSSSSMFRITECRLTVQDGKMTARMIMGGTGYEKIFSGTGEEAASASESEYIPYEELEDGRHSFCFPVPALDQKISCSAFSRKKQMWYDRDLVFRSDSLPLEAFAQESRVTAETLGLEDGEYLAEVSLEGGSGRTAVESPAVLKVEDGKMTAVVRWESPNYDYMRVDGEQYWQINTEGNSVFEIPVSSFDRRLAVTADTVAMSVPHEIDYCLTFHSHTLKKTETGGEQKQKSHTLTLSYATGFSVDYDENGCAWIHIPESGEYVVVPDSAEIPAEAGKKVTVIRQNPEQVYLAATSAMDLICALGSEDRVTLSGTDRDGWYIEEAREAMESGTMTYAGRYNAPDYEQILAKGCDLAVESTMILHAPEVKEQLERLGIPVLVERSSYESHPLGRMEWIKLYGVLFGKEELAEELFEACTAGLEFITEDSAAGKTAAFFYINGAGSVNVRKPGDYVAKMIGMAGGTYVPSGLKEEENAFSTMNMQMEAFYAAAKDADFLIYNSAVDKEPENLNELLEKSSLLEDFKAVKEGNVWCTGKNLFQETMGLGSLLRDLNLLFRESAPDPGQMTYLKRLEWEEAE